MEHDELAGQSREELLELVQRQQAELAAREAAIERRDEKIRELEEELSQFRRPVEDARELVGATVARPEGEPGGGSAPETRS